MRLIALDGTLYFAMRCKDGSRTPTAPAAAPTYTICLGDADNAVTSGTGTMTSLVVSGITGGYRASHSIASANYSRGQTYTIFINYTTGGTARGEEQYFTVT